MKRITLTLAMLLCLSAAYNQTSRRSTNTRELKKAAQINAHNNSSTRRNDRLHNFNRKHNAPTDKIRNNRKQYYLNYNRHSTRTYPNRKSRYIYVNARSNHHHRSHKGYHTGRYHYRKPIHYRVYWTRNMRYRYARYYPAIRWKYRIGYNISTIPAYNAHFYMGEVMNVYGIVTEAIYSRERDEYYLYFGRMYPYHTLSVVVPGWIARQSSRRPLHYFNDGYFVFTGYIGTYNGKPEMVIHEINQISAY